MTRVSLIGCIFMLHIGIAHSLTQLEKDALLDLSSVDAFTIMGWQASTVDLACNWTGILCNAQQNVISIETPRSIDCQATNILPTSIGKLSYLEVFIFYCPLTGLPNEFQSLTSLQILTLRQLSNSLPDVIGRLIALKQVTLEGTYSGTIPPSYQNLTNLENFSLNSIYLAGTIPTGLTELKNLTKFGVYYAPITGVIPSFANIRNLRDISFYGTNLAGTLPPSYGYHTNLQAITLRGDFSGPIPSLWSSLTNLIYLEINAPISGTIPSFIASFSLMHLILTSDNLTGTIPSAVIETGVRYDIAIKGKGLVGPLVLTKQSTLRSLDLTSAAIGSISETFQLFTGLSTLKMVDCSLQGTIPSFIGSLPLQYLDLSYNSLVGCIPSGLNRTFSTACNLKSNYFCCTEPNAVSPCGAIVDTEDCVAPTVPNYERLNATLSQAREYLVATSVGKYALFAGGLFNNSYSNVVDIFDSTTQMWSTASLSSPRAWLAATSVGKYALFAGGMYYNGVSAEYIAVVDIFDSVAGTWSTSSISQGRSNLAATSVGKYALFAGGSNVVDIFDSTTQSWSTATLSQARSSLAATSVGKYALIAGGAGSATVDIFDSTTQSWSMATLSQGRSSLAATSTGKYAIFAGGYIDGMSDVVDIFNSVTQTWSTAQLSQTRFHLAAASVGNYALFSPGAGTYVPYVYDMYDAYNRRWSTVPANLARFALAATSVGNFSLFAGGSTSSGDTNVVEIFYFTPASPIATP